MSSVCSSTLKTNLENILSYKINKPLESSGLTSHETQVINQKISSIIVKSIKNSQYTQKRHSINLTNYSFTFNLSFLNKTCAKIHLYLPGELKTALLGEGSKKKVKKSITLIIELANNLMFSKIKETTIQRIKKDIELDEAIEGVKMHKKIHSLLGAKNRFISEPPEMRFYFSSKKRMQRLEMEQIRYEAGDLRTAIKNGLCLYSTIKVLADIATVLNAMHEIGYVHSDVKNLNILLSETSKNNFIGILNDFDFTQKLGLSDTIGEDYCYWDDLRLEGITTPYTDVYGLVLSIGECLIPYFFNRREELEEFRLNILNNRIFNEDNKRFIRCIDYSIDSFEGEKSFELKNFILRLCLENTSNMTTISDSVKMYNSIITAALQEFKPQLSPKQLSELQQINIQIPMFAGIILMMKREVFNNERLFKFIKINAKDNAIKKMLDNNYKLKDRVMIYKELTTLIGLSTAESIAIELMQYLNSYFYYPLNKL